MQGGPSLPLLLDVLLVGRTKMLRLHSCIWLQNNTSMRLQPCIQLGAGCRTPVVLAPGDKLDAMQRLHLRVSGCGRLTCNEQAALALHEANRAPHATLPDMSSWLDCAYSVLIMYVLKYVSIVSVATGAEAEGGAVPASSRCSGWAALPGA